MVCFGMIFFFMKQPDEFIGVKFDIMSLFELE